MQIVLLERIEKLGQMGDVVNVKPGFARNFLLPKGKALRATKANLARFEEDRVQLEARNLEAKSEAEAVGVKLEGHTCVVIRQAGEAGQLYGSVSGRDVASLLGEDGYTVLHSQVVLDRPIKEIGLHDVGVSLHPEVRVGIILNVARTEGEAELQAKGEDVLAVGDDFDEDETELEEFFEEGAAPEGDAEGEGEADDATASDTADTDAPSDEEETPST